MKRSHVIAVVVLIGFSKSLWAVPTPVYTILSDKGSAGDDIFVFGPAAGNSVALDSTTTNPPPPEGFRSMKAVSVSATATWAVVYLTSTKAKRSVDLSAYANGEIRFWANCNTDNFSVFVQHLDGSEDGYDYSGTFGGAFNQWVPVIFPFGPITAPPAPETGFPINNIFSPFLIEANQAVTCFIDNVRYINPPATTADIFSVAVKNISNQQPASQFTWSSLALPTGWARSDQYIELQTDVETFGWGVQIYTDNTRTSANPKFVSGVASGKPGSDPAGLIDNVTPSRALPIAWSIKATGVAAPVPAEPNNNGIKGPVDNNAFQWLYMKDLQTPTISSAGTTAFQNGDPFVVVKNNVGNHFGQQNSEFGPEDTPNSIYLEANFSGAVTPRTYQTTALIVEFFYE